MPIELFFNWKMNPNSFDEALDLVLALSSSVSKHIDIQVAVFPPSVFLQNLSLERKERQLPLNLGAQDVSSMAFGALTGENSAIMFKDLGVDYVLIGHSETRKLHHLTNLQVNQKIQQAIEQNIIPILCIGFEPNLDKTDINYVQLAEQIQMGLRDISTTNIIYIAYEPVWAIGTGKTADNHTIQTVVDFIKKEVKKLTTISQIKILYGGSVDEKTIDTLLEIQNLSGFLVGGASLKPEKFTLMIDKISLR